MQLNEYRVLLGVSAGIAGYKAAELVRLLQTSGCDVQVIMTKRATHFIGAETFRGLTQHPVGIDEFHDEVLEPISHIHYARDNELFVIAPATADIIAKLACGIADDLLSTTALVYDPERIVVAPAMNTHMYENPAVQANLKLLAERGVKIIEPEFGRLACGTSGKGKLAEPSQIARSCLSILTKKTQISVSSQLESKRVLITLGPTHEPLDAVRYIGNKSSGKMGLSLSRRALEYGAELHVIHGPLAPGLLESYLGNPRDKLQCYPLVTAQEMYDQTMELLNTYSFDFIICTAAVADFRPEVCCKGKIKKGDLDIFELKLVRNPDILAELSRKKQEGRLNSYLVGFAAETSHIETYSEEKIRKKPVDALVVNDVSCDTVGFGSNDNAAFVLSIRKGSEGFELCRLGKFGLMSKDDLAEKLWELFIAEECAAQKSRA